MKKILKNISILFLSTFVFFSWSNLNAKELLIGGAACETGMQAPLDTPGINGAKVAVKYLNDEKGGILGRPVKFVNL
jgi:ABC-type branched-chain amino acid transport systems, periplasmic component